MSETTYYQKNREIMLNRARLRKQARNKYRYKEGIWKKQIYKYF